MDDDKTSIFEGFGAHLPFEDVSHYLVIELESGRKKHIEIEVEPVVFGRSASATHRLHDSLVSGRHCQVFLEGTSVIVEDLDSTNGTFVDRRKVMGRNFVPIGSVLQVGRHRLKHEIRSRDEVLRQERFADELERASAYVQSLLPTPIRDGELRTCWRFIPSAHLGGDAFGYHWLDADRFAMYLLDVCGHGPSAALHSVSVLNLIRRRHLPGLDLASPEAVLAELNCAFPMENYGGMYFSIWYGVYDRRSRRLTFATAGHPPGYLRSATSPGLVPLHTDGLAAGMLPDVLYDSASVELPAASRIYVFSDGVFEFRTKDGGHSSFDDLPPILAAPEIPEVAETARIEEAVRSRMSGKNFPDDFSLLVVDIA